jgi:hypothetical protein
MSEVESRYALARKLNAMQRTARETASYFIAVTALLWRLAYLHALAEKSPGFLQIGEEVLTAIARAL